MLRHILERASYHAVYDASIPEALRWAGEHGFSGVQADVQSPHLAFERMSAEERRHIRQYLDEHGLRLSLHAPDFMASLLETSRHLRAGIIAYFRALFEFALDVGCRLVTVHPGMAATFGTDGWPRVLMPEMDLPLYRQALRENLDDLLAMRPRELCLCMENYGMDAMVRETIQPYLNRGELHLCWDLPKTYGADLTLELEHFMWANLRHIRQVHLHDIDGYSHRAMGTGRLDFMRYLPRLSEANVLDWCHEVRPRERAAESLANLRRMVASDAPRPNEPRP